MAGRSASAGCEDHNRRAPGDHTRDRRNVIPWRIHNESTFLSWPRCFLENLGNRTSSSLMDTTETFFFDCRQTANFVTGRRLAGSAILPS